MHQKWAYFRSDERKRITKCGAVIDHCSTILALRIPTMNMPKQDDLRWSLVVHGGVEIVERMTTTPAIERRYRSALLSAIEIGGDILARGGTAIDAVTAAIRFLEDNELFNAGRGAVLTADGKYELDASIMDGGRGEAGAVASLTRTRNPILAARAVMEHSPHVMLVGEGAESFARSRGLSEVEASYFFTEQRWRELTSLLEQRCVPVPPRPSARPQAQNIDPEGVTDHCAFGTVGAVAYDTSRSIAAGTSTGGVTGKHGGRVGDSALIGAGTFARNGVCGISATGTGEAFIRVGAARAIAARIELSKMTCEQALLATLAEVDALNGKGGLIALDANGHHTWAMNTSAMYRAAITSGGEVCVRILSDE